MNHRHVILTIDEGLRNIFLEHRELLKEFMNEGEREWKMYDYIPFEMLRKQWQTVRRWQRLSNAASGNRNILISMEFTLIKDGLLK